MKTQRTITERKILGEGPKQLIVTATYDGDDRNLTGVQLNSGGAEGEVLALSGETFARIQRAVYSSANACADHGTFVPDPSKPDATRYACPSCPPCDTKLALVNGAKGKEPTHVA